MKTKFQVIGIVIALVVGFAAGFFTADFRYTHKPTGSSLAQLEAARAQLNKLLLVYTYEHPQVKQAAERVRQLIEQHEQQAGKQNPRQ